MGFFDSIVSQVQEAVEDVATAAGGGDGTSPEMQASSTEESCTMGFFDSIVSQVQEAVEDVATAAGGGDGTSPEMQAFFQELGVDKVIEGIKEALSVAIAKAVDITGHTDGFLANELIKISLPPQVRAFEDALRSAGLGSIVDQFELSMNRAAEESAPLARDVFVTSIREMTVDDAQKIWRGDDKTAATTYLQRTCTPQLTAHFAPKVSEAMDRTSLTRVYNELTERVSPIPIIGDLFDGFNLEEYTVTQALEGLFKVMAEEETRVRIDPASAASSLIETVFARQAFREE
eukprot:CAMPEP_0114612430 /NCGR_PEP_ID=MMETSP0168-20121206/4617_1 /TAXON_ID=95228 ORGANISM="Vannella sp., Strain DIVA3 517/6/12" /NCGR_SAMPLE_ID=MMETSP0168 /ASSEMBLY_ACC=CAM_ASM_000044 /LENGTH=289 /DNA_ID=CAMNT_0001823413 /DNA_START=41 /DNA_END=911 /DNA_ORIENTATION=+